MGTVLSRLKKLEHEYAVLALICSVDPDARKDVQANYSKKHYLDAVERAVLKLFAYRLDVPIAMLLNILWNSGSCSLEKQAFLGRETCGMSGMH